LRCGILERFDALRRDFGDIARIQVGPRAAFFFAHPDHVHELLVTQHARLHKGTRYERLKLLLGEGLLTSSGALHARQRRLLAPMLKFSRLRRYGGVMAEVADSLGARWVDGSVRDVHEDMTHLTLRILGRALFSSDLDRHEDLISDTVRLGSRIIEKWGQWPHARLLVRLPLPLSRAFRARQRQFEEMIQAMIADRRGAGAGKDDVVSYLVQAARDGDARATMSDRQVRDEVVTLLLSGHETTSSAMAWAWYLLSQHPDQERRVHEEVDAVLGRRLPSVDDLPRLEVCRSVLLETLRLYPPIYGLSRRVAEEIAVGGYRIPRRSRVYMSQYAIHRDPRFWVEPARFDPDRWRDPQLSSGVRAAYFPFGLGPRRCVGEAFFWIEAPIILATLARRWSFRLAEGESAEASVGVTLRPRDGLRMRLAARVPAP
jgi:cytochrome P450